MPPGQKPWLTARVPPHTNYHAFTFNPKSATI